MQSDVAEARLSQRERSVGVVKFCSIAPIAVGGAVLIGWEFRVEFLKNPLFIAGSSFMTPNAAVCFIVAGVSLYSLYRGDLSRRSQVVGQVLAGALSVFSVLTILEYLTGADFAIDRIFFHHRLAEWTLKPPVGRFALPTAIAFTCLGAALLFFKLTPVREYLAIAAAFVTFVNIVGYLYGAQPLYAFNHANNIALHTAITLMVVSAGVFLSCPEKGIAAIIFSPDTEGRLARRFLVGVTVLLPFMGWLRLITEHRGFVEHSMATAVLVCASVVVFVALTISSVRQLKTKNGKRRTAEHDLRASEEQFRQMAEMIPQLAWMANAGGWVFWYNRRWYEYTGTTLAHMQGWGWQSVHDPATLPNVLDRWRASICSGEPFEMVFPLRGADGLFRPFLTRVAPLRNEQGKVVRWFGTNTDITVEREAERKVRESEQQLIYYRPRSSTDR